MIKVKRLDADLPLPTYATQGSAGMDIMSAMNVEIKPMEVVAIKTGFSMELEQGFEAQIRPRSGHALKGITVINSPGTIDSDYRGEVCVILINLGSSNFVVTRGMRIAQMVIAAYCRSRICEVECLGETVRGHGGFGSTGV